MADKSPSKNTANQSAWDIPPSRFQFSSKTIPASQRLTVVREVVGRATMNMDFNPTTDDLDLELDVHVLPGVIVSGIQGFPHRSASSFDRSRDSDDFTLLWAPTPAKGRVTQFGKEHPADESAILCSCADIAMVETHEAFPHTVLKLQRSLLLPRLPDAEALLMRPVSAHNEALQLLNAYLAAYRALPDTPSDPNLAQLAATHIADLVALAVGTTRDATHLMSVAGLRAARLVAIKRWIRDRLGSPELSIHTAAAAIGLNPRSGQLLFETESNTFTTYVLRERLTKAYRYLSAPSHAHRTIANIAHACGFGDLSHFNHSFRRAYGETPSEVRHRTGGLG
jgi:AraC-like DNA-binding protein